jgi:nucleotide-binding universal stress UspA family protein
VEVQGERPAVSVGSIVYATDFSTCSENAGAYAKMLAEFFSARLLVTHAFLLTQAAMEVEQLKGKLSKQREDLRVRVDQKAKGLSSASFQAEAVLLAGHPNEVIPALAEKNAPAMIVLGTHGAGLVEHELIGSAAEKILRSTRWPCLTVGPHTAPPSNDPPPFRRILYATDLNPSTARAAQYALAFAEQVGGSIDVLNVIPEVALEDPAGWEELRKQHQDDLRRLIPDQANEFCSPHTFVEPGTAYERIMGHLEQDAIDLLVLGIRKTPFLSLEMRTSGAFRLIANAPCPVLTVMG